MANNEHLAILRQGVKVWNEWVEQQNPKIMPDLCDADLHDTDFSKASLGWVDLSRSDLRGACLRGADLHRAKLNEVVLRDADLSWAILYNADLRNANLCFAVLHNADLSRADLRWADLSHARLREAVLNGAKLSEADLSEAWTELTTFGYNDLSTVKGLDTVRHTAPSYISIDTIYRSKGNIPEVFLRGAGVPDNFIKYMRSLTGHAFDLYSCFISYSSKDHAFAERLHADLQSQGVRCWFAPEDLKIGDRIRPRIDETIRTYDKLLLVLSKHSVRSQWVEQEVETALAKERETERTVLFPIRLDEEVMKTQTGWPALIRNTRNIGDFRRWKNHDEYQKAFSRLLRDLKAE